MKTSLVPGSDGHRHSLSRREHGRPSTTLAWAPRLRRVTAAALFSIGLVVLMTQQTGHAQQGTDPLPYSGGFLVTGNYVVGGVDLTHQNNPTQFDANLGISFSTGTLNISNVPPNADILAAYLYWETIHLVGVPNPELGVRFDDHDVNDPNIPVPLVKSSAE